MLSAFERGNSFEDPTDAIHRETQLKQWRRDKKEALIAGKNPAVEDLTVTVLELPAAIEKPWEAR